MLALGVCPGGKSQTGNMVERLVKSSTLLFMYSFLWLESSGVALQRGSAVSDRVHTGL